MDFSFDSGGYSDHVNVELENYLAATGDRSVDNELNFFFNYRPMVQNGTIPPGIVKKSKLYASELNTGPNRPHYRAKRYKR